MQFSVGPCLRARVSPTGHFLELLPPVVLFPSSSGRGMLRALGHGSLLAAAPKVTKNAA